jgi:PadR family transcriptional regulator PadR
MGRFELPTAARYDTSQYEVYRSMRQTNPNFMNGIPELLILSRLHVSEMYGYELVQVIRAETSGAVNLSEGVVYPTLHSLELEGALKSRRKVVNGRSRVYYSTTARGSRRLAKLASSWSELAGAVQGILGAKHAIAV